MSGVSGARRRVRWFVGGRSTTQKVGVVAVLAVLATAPFGGLGRSDAGIARIALHTRYDVGPYYLTIDKVETQDDVKPFIYTKPTQQLLIIEVTVTNHTNRAEYMSLVTEVLGADHTGGIPWPGDSDLEARMYDVADGTQAFQEMINPGATYQLALVVKEPRGFRPDHLTLSLLGCDYEVKNELTTLEDNVWQPRFTLAQGPVPVEDKA